jgi:hypothetical protein
MFRAIDPSNPGLDCLFPNSSQVSKISSPTSFSHHLLCLVSVHHCRLRDGFPVRRLTAARELNDAKDVAKVRVSCLHVHKTYPPPAFEPRLRYQLYKQSDGVSLLMSLRRSTPGYVYTTAIIPVDSTKYNTGCRDTLTWFEPELLDPMTWVRCVLLSIGV